MTTIKEIGSAVRRLTKTMLLLAAALLVGGILALAPQGEAKAADATEIEVNTDVIGAIETSSTVDYYSFTVPEDGYFYITLANTDTTKTAERNMKIYNLSDSTSGSFASYSGYSSLTTAKIPSVAGKNYMVAVSNYSTYSYNSVGVSYTLRINCIADPTWEKED